MDEFTKMMAISVCIGLSVLGFAIWVIVKLMQYFGVI